MGDISLREQAIIDGINLLDQTSAIITTAFDREFLNRIKSDREKGWPLTDYDYNRLMEICNRVMKLRQTSGVIPDWLLRLTFQIEHNPNCPSKFLLRVCHGARLDKLHPVESNDYISHGITLDQAIANMETKLREEDPNANLQ